MPQKKLIRLILILLASIPLYAQSSSLHVKPGAWEYTVTSTMSIPKSMIPPDRLKSMPPELRAKILDPKPVTTTGNSCVKESDTFESAIDTNNLNMKCERKNVKQTSTTYEADMTCTQKAPQGREKTFNMHVRFEEKSPERVVSTSDANSPYGSTHSVTQSRWLSASCSDIPEHPVQENDIPGY